MTSTPCLYRELRGGEDKVILEPFLGRLLVPVRWSLRAKAQVAPWK
jgi:hypothetical protein